MSRALAGWSLVHPPAGEFRWVHQGQTWVSTGEELWRVSDSASVWPIDDVDALVVDGSAVLVRTCGHRLRLDRPATSGRVREGIHATAMWTGKGWQIPSIPLPYGARWASSLWPTAIGVGAVWTNEGQAFEASFEGVCAVRTRDERWWKRHRDIPHAWAVTCSEHLLWGPGGHLWDLRSGACTAVDRWTGGLAASKGDAAVLVNILTGAISWFEGNKRCHTDEIPLRRDMVASVVWNESVVLTTELGKRFVLDDRRVQKLPGRILADAPEQTLLPELGIAVDGMAHVCDSEWAWRQDGLLLRRR